MNILKNLKNKFFFKEIIYSLSITLFVFILDRWTKTTIINTQIMNESFYINDYLNYDLVWNTGISFGLFSQNANIYYHMISFLIFIVIIFLCY